MNNATEKIQRITSRGQITLPINWRREFNIDQIMLRSKGKIIEILPFNIKQHNKEEEYTVFDAIRDNKGRGIKATDLVKMIKKIDK